MKVSFLKISRKKEVIKRLELSELAEMIRENPEKEKVFNLRLNYQFCKPKRMPDGQITLDDQQHTANLPRLLFAAECMNYKEMQKGLKYNGLVVVEANGLKTYEEAVSYLRKVDCLRRRTIYDCFTRTCMRQLGGPIRTSSVWISSILSQRWSGRSI